MWALSLNNHIFVAISMILYFSKKKKIAEKYFRKYFCRIFAKYFSFEKTW
jgi:hypothetical protein